MSKRKQPPGGGGGNYLRKRGGGNFKRVRMGQSSADLASGICGVLVTHAPGKAGPCVIEMRDWLMTWIDQLYPVEQASEAPEDEQKEAAVEAASVSVDSALEAELRELRGEAEAERRKQRRENPEAAAESSRRQLREVPQVARGSQAVCLHLSHPGGADVAEAVRQMLLAVQRGEEPVRAKHAIKITPLQVTCFSDPEVLQKAAQPLVERILGSEPPGTTWGIVFDKTQENDRMGREDCIFRLTSLVPRHCVVDLRNPKWTFLVKVMGRVTGFAIVRDHKPLARYNLRELRAQAMDKFEANLNSRRVASQAQDQEQQQQQEEEDDDEDEVEAEVEAAGDDAKAEVESEENGSAGGPRGDGGVAEATPAEAEQE